MEIVPLAEESTLALETLKEPLPDLSLLHLRHSGLTPHLCHCFAEAAGVCLSRHHLSPVLFKLTHNSLASRREVSWQSPVERTKRAWANRDDATRDGAYALALAAVEAELGLVAIERADTGTGADYFVASPGEADLETAYRLEISGIDQGNERAFRSRLGTKVLQVRNGAVDGSALVAVVGFGSRRIAMIEVEEAG